MRTLAAVTVAVILAWCGQAHAQTVRFPCTEYVEMLRQATIETWRVEAERDVCRNDWLARGVVGLPGEHATAQEADAAIRALGNIPGVRCGKIAYRAGWVTVCY